MFQVGIHKNRYSSFRNLRNTEHAVNIIKAMY